MGRPKNSTRARRINLSKTASHRRHRKLKVEDRAPTEARNSKKILNVLEKNTRIDNQEECDDGGKEEALCTSSDSSSIICLDRGDEEDVDQQISTSFNMVLSKGLENWQKSAAEKLASSNRPRHYSRRSLTTMYRGKLAAKKNGQTLKDLWKPVVSPKK